MKLLNKLSENRLVGGIVTKVITGRVNQEIDAIADHFQQYLKPIYATNSQLKDDSYRIRHEVYCEELKFEEMRANQLEQDEFDAYSQACIIQHKPSKDFAGTVRVVSPERHDQPLPIEKYCSEVFRHSSVKPSDFKYSEVSEISRLAILPHFRRRKSDHFKGSETGAINEKTFSTQEMRCFPFISIGLYLAAASTTIDSGRHHVFVMMEPRLARSMALVGIRFKQIGDPIEYHGTRAPYYISSKIFFDSLPNGFLKLHNIIQDSLKAQHSQLKLQSTG